MLTKFYGKETTMEELYFTIRSFHLGPILESPHHTSFM